MGLFSSIEIDSKLIPYIQRGEGVGIVKIEGLGKSSARIESNQLILDSYESNQGIKINFQDINLLSYNQGNFINEPKMHIGTSRRQYVLAGVDNNDDELERFYNTVLDIKDRQQQGLQNNRQQQSNRQHHKGMPHPNSKVTNPNKQSHNIKNDFNSHNSFNNKEITSPSDFINKKINRHKNDYMSQDNKSDFNSYDSFDDEEITSPSDFINKKINKNTNDYMSQENEPDYTLHDSISNDNYISQDLQKDPVAEIRRYYELKEDGIITEEDFNKKKKQLLGI